MKILVTGGRGFLGAAVAQALAKRGDSVVAADRTLPTEQPGHGQIISVAFDIANRLEVDAIIAQHKPDAVVHCAAIVIGVLPGAEGTGDIIRVNIEGSVNLFESAARHDVKRVLHVSSEEIYGDFQQDPAEETHALDPRTPYAITKAAVEQLGRHYGRSLGLEVINLRTSWVYGPGLPRVRIPKSLVDAAVRGESLHLPHGAETRIDHTYIDDFTDGVLGALDAEGLAHDTYHLGSGSAASIAELIEAIKTVIPAADLSAGGGPILDGAGELLPRKGALDNTRAEAAFGYRPRYPVALGVARYIEQLRAAERGND